MFKIVPLLIVLVSLTVLWVLGKLFSRANRQSEEVLTTKLRGTNVYPHMHVVGLNEHGIQELKSLIEAKDIENLSIFIALKKPTFVELDNYIDTLRARFMTILNKPLKAATDIEKITATSTIDISNTPKGYDFSQISKSELRTLIEHDQKTRRVINHEFISRFGEARFMETFNVYKQLSSEIPVTLLVAENEPNRRQLDIMVKTGLALQGRKIPLQDRLSVLKYTDLRNMAKELKLDKDFKRRADATAALAEIPGSAILLAMQVNIDDIFMIKPEPIDIEAVDNEWVVINSYAKLIC